MRKRWSVASLLLFCCLVWAAGLDLSSVMSGILKTESGGNPNSILDNSTHKSYRFNSASEAIQMATYLVSLNHNIDMGLYQVNSIHLSRGWSISNLFDSAFNATAAQTIFNEWLDKARKLYGDTQLAWERAIGAYNAGFAGLKNGNPAYTNKVLRNMGNSTPALDHDAPMPAPAAAQPSSHAISTAVTKNVWTLKGLPGLDDDDDEDDLMSPEPARARHQASENGAEVLGGILGIVAVIALALMLFKLSPALLRIGARKAMSATKKQFDDVKNAAAGNQ